MGVFKLFGAAIFLAFCIIAASCTASRQQTQTSDNVQRPPAKTYVFQCQDGSSFPVRIERDKALIYLPVGVVSVPRVATASGAKYTDGKTSIWHRGKDALVQLGGKAYGVCINNPREVPWEEAKLNGVDFRAAGQNPEWYLEITYDRNILFVTDSGKKKYEFPFVQPETNESDFTRIYESKNNSQRFKVTIVELQCRDASSGEQFPTSVTVNMNGKSYRGCGRPLQ